MKPRLDLVDLDQPTLIGQRRFISCWVCRGPRVSFLVDPGPPSTAAALVERLRELDVTHLDYVLLTHVHLDHGGAVADVLDAFPAARVGCHPRGRPHLIEPARLWEGSQKVLGPTAAVYGEPRPVPAASLADNSELAERGIVTMATPGHAPHHVSFCHDETLFIGEAAGTFQELPAGGWYLRPATPPRFVLQVALDSLDRLLSLRPAPARIAFAHHGLLDGRVEEVLAEARDQLLSWVDEARAVVSELPDAVYEEQVQAVVERLDATDRYFGRRRELPDDIQEREAQFTRQSLRGIFGYLDLG